MVYFLVLVIGIIAGLRAIAIGGAILVVGLLR